MRTHEVGSLQEAFPRVKITVYHDRGRTAPVTVTPDGLVLVETQGNDAHRSDVQLLDPVSGRLTLVRTLRQDRYGNMVRLISAVAGRGQLAWIEGSDNGKAGPASWAVMIQDRRTRVIRQVAHSPMPTGDGGTCPGYSLVLGSGRLWWSGCVGRNGSNYTEGIMTMPLSGGPTVLLRRTGVPLLATADGVVARIDDHPEQPGDTQRIVRLDMGGREHVLDHDALALSGQLSVEDFFPYNDSRHVLRIRLTGGGVYDLRQDTPNEVVAQGPLAAWYRATGGGGWTPDTGGWLFDGRSRALVHIRYGTKWLMSNGFVLLVTTPNGNEGGAADYALAKSDDLRL